MSKKYILEDNISTKGILTTAGSEFLKNFTPIYDATIIKKLSQNNYSLLKKASVIEFGFEDLEDQFNEDKKSFNSLKEKEASIMLGIDRRGKGIKLSSKYGLNAFKPSFGFSSKYGLFPLTSSLESLVIYSSDIKEINEGVEVLKGKDVHDMNTFSITNHNDFSKNLFVFSEDIIDKTNQEIVTKLEKKGYKITKMSKNELFDYIESTNLAISLVEAISNLANLTGIGFGERVEKNNIEETIVMSRTKGFTLNSKINLIAGEYLLSSEVKEKYFLPAKKIRRLIVEYFKENFNKFGTLLLFNNEQLDLSFTNLGGFPYFSLPLKDKNINLVNDTKKDYELLNLVAKIKEDLNV